MPSRLCNVVATVTLKTALLLIVSGVAWATDPLRIVSGPEGGTYDSVYAAALASRLADSGASVVHTAGTVANIEAIASGRADLGFAQTDVFADMLLGDASYFEKVRIIGAMGRECVFLAVADRGPVRRLADLESPIGDRPARVAVGPPASGTFGTWRFLSHLAPGLERVEAIDDHGVTAVERVSRGELDAVLWVTDPANDRHAMRVAVADDDALRFASVAGRGVGTTLPNGIRVYNERRIRFGMWPFGRKVSTLCTRALLIGRADLDESVIDAASGVVEVGRDDLVRMGGVP